jgi:transposase
MKKQRRGGLPTKWDDSHYVKVYEMARSGMTKNEISKALGVDRETWSKWVKIRPALAEALRRGHSPSGEQSGEKFFEYVYKRLPRHLQRVWAALEVYEEEGAAEEMIESLFEDRGVRARQHLWVHALVASNFNASEACRRVNVTRNTLEGWVQHDPGFAELIDHLHQMKKDFAEGCLFGLLARGDTAATIFANRTLNRDRGYDPKVTVVHEGLVGHLHTKVDVDELAGFSRAEKRAILEKLRGPAQLPAHGDALDAEFTVKEKKDG